jgi:hypothetical protein
VNLAIHNLLQDKLRFALSVTGVALAVMLILFLLGLREGMFHFYSEREGHQGHRADTRARSKQETRGNPFRPGSPAVRHSIIWI